MLIRVCITEIKIGTEKISRDYLLICFFSRGMFHSTETYYYAVNKRNWHIRRKTVTTIYITNTFSGLRKIVALPRSLNIFIYTVYTRTISTRTLKTSGGHTRMDPPSATDNHQVPYFQISKYIMMEYTWLKFMVFFNY